MRIINRAWHTEPIAVWPGGRLCIRALVLARETWIKRLYRPRKPEAQGSSRFESRSLASDLVLASGRALDLARFGSRSSDSDLSLDSLDLFECVHNLKLCQPFAKCAIFTVRLDTVCTGEECKRWALFIGILRRPSDARTWKSLLLWRFQTFWREILTSASDERF